VGVPAEPEVELLPQATAVRAGVAIDVIEAILFILVIPLPSMKALD